MIALHTETLPLLGTTTLAATDRGLCLLWTGPKEGAEAYLRRCCGSEPLAEAPDRLEEAVRQLREYLTGRRTEFTLPLDARGTPFQLQVWAALCAIPYGETRSYGEIAAAIGRPTAVRAVGAANGANPIAVIVPCHRVIGSNGKLVGYGLGLPLKQTLLNLEQQNAG